MPRQKHQAGQELGFRQQLHPLTVKASQQHRRFGTGPLRGEEGRQYFYHVANGPDFNLDRFSSLQLQVAALSGAQGALAALARFVGLLVPG